MIQSAASVVLLADSSKAGRLDLHCFGWFGAVDVMITNAGVEAGVLDELCAQGSEVVLA
jgi:DeoR/GlpR family transcriptional regulator of sugar metabolism